MLFDNSRNHIATAPDIKIDGVKINEVDKTKFLGVIINNKLAWDDHIKTVTQKIQEGAYNQAYFTQKHSSDFSDN